MNPLNNNQKQGIALVLAGTLIAVLAIHPPKWLTRLYLVLERAVAACAGVLLAVAGAAALMGLARQPGANAEPVYTIHFEEDGAETANEDKTNQ